MDVGTAGWLHKLGGGKSDGFKWQRRFFSLRGSSLTYHTLAAEASGAKLAPRGVVNLPGCTVLVRPETAGADGSLRFEFALTHPCGDTLVLAAATEAERQRWIESLQLAARGDAGLRTEAPATQPTALPSTDPRAAAPDTTAPNAEPRAPAELTRMEAELAESEHGIAELEAKVEAALRERDAATKERERGQAELREATAALHLRMSLLHWRGRTLGRCFGQLAAAATIARAQAGGAS